MAFSFLWFYLIVFIFLPILVRHFETPVSEQSGKQALCVPFFKEIANTTPAVQRAFSKKGILFYLAWIFFVIALMRPVFYGQGIFIPNKARQIMLVLDVSGSMAEQDFVLNNQRMTRLGATKAIASDFFKHRQGDAVGLIIFGTEPYVYVPLTQDIKTAQNMLQEVGVGIAGEKTAIGDALGLALKQMQDIPSDNKVVIFLSDGSANAGILDPKEAISMAKQMNTKIYTIGLGSDEQIINFGFFAQRINPSADLDERLLKEMATETGGQYFRVKNSEELKAVYEQIDKLEPVDSDGIYIRPQKELFWIPLVMCMLLFLCGFIFNQRLL